MTLEVNKNRWAAAVCWIMTFLCMGFIFYMSARPAGESDQMSGAVMLWLENVFGTALTNFIVRKLAHFLEFAFFSFILNWSIYYTRNRKPSYVWATAAASFYAATDEIHQLFVSGRACQFQDWVIDTCGALIGTLCVLLLLFTTKKIVKKRLAKGGETT